MDKFSEKIIERLQDNLLTIRKIVGWTTEDLGKRIGVTKQTISNLENKKTKMTLTQYIAIRSVLDYELQVNQNQDSLIQIVSILLDEDLHAEKEEIVGKAEMLSMKGDESCQDATHFSGQPSFGVTSESPVIGAAVSGPTWLSKLLKKITDDKIRR